MTKILAALDVGNANTKLKLFHPDDGEKLITIPSAIEMLPDAEYDGAFTYEGSHKDLCPKYWLPEATGSHRWVMDTLDGKPTLCLPLLLSAIADHIEDGDELTLVASVHNVDAFEHKMISALSGDHIFQKTGDKPKYLAVNVHRVLSEGVGAIYASAPRSPNNWLLDLGGDTAIGTPYLKLKIRPGCNPYPLTKNGARRLIGEFAKCKAVSQTLGTGQVLTFDQSRKVLDDPKHILNKTSLKDAVAYEVDRWLADVVGRVENLAGHHLAQCDTRIANGGSCLIPEVAKWLKGRGYSIAPSPLTANVDGMLSILRKEMR